MVSHKKKGKMLKYSISLATSFDTLMPTNNEYNNCCPISVQFEMGQKSTQVRNDENGVKIEFIEILTQAQPIYINLDLLCECLISFFFLSLFISIFD